MIRPAGPGDEIAVADVHVRSWQAAYRGIVPDSYLDSLRPEDRAARYTFHLNGPSDPRTWVLEDEGVIRGFSTIGPGRGHNAPDGVGELYAIYLDPGWWDRGAGRLLIEDARRRLVEGGYQRAFLWVLQENHRARRFYEKDGWRFDGESADFEIDGVAIPEVRYARELP